MKLATRLATLPLSIIAISSIPFLQSCKSEEADKPQEPASVNKSLRIEPLCAYDSQIIPLQEGMFENIALWTNDSNWQRWHYNLLQTRWMPLDSKSPEFTEDAKTLNVLAYAPYREAIPAETGTEPKVSYAIPNKTASGFPAIEYSQGTSPSKEMDLLWASASASEPSDDEPAELMFYHALTQVTFEIDKETYKTIPIGENPYFGKEFDLWPWELCVTTSSRHPAYVSGLFNLETKNWELQRNNGEQTWTWDQTMMPSITSTLLTKRHDLWLVPSVSNKNIVAEIVFSYQIPETQAVKEARCSATIPTGLGLKCKVLIPLDGTAQARVIVSDLNSTDSTVSANNQGGIINSK